MKPRIYAASAVKGLKATFPVTQRWLLIAGAAVVVQALH